MMKILVYICIGLTALWLQLTLAQWLAWGGSLKPNFPLLTTLLLSLSGIGAAIFPYAAIMGLTQDVLSHNIHGIYSISFTLTAFAIRGFAAYINYQQSILLIATVFLFAMLESIFAWFLLQFSLQRPPLASWLLSGIQMSGYTALLALLVNRLLRGILPNN